MSEAGLDAEVREDPGDDHGLHAELRELLHDVGVVERVESPALCSLHPPQMEDVISNENRSRDSRQSISEALCFDAE